MELCILTAISHILKLKETEEKLRIVEEFAKETSDKYTELLENQNNRQKMKNLECNKDQQQLKAVRFILTRMRNLY